MSVERFRFSSEEGETPSLKEQAVQEIGDVVSFIHRSNADEEFNYDFERQSDYESPHALALLTKHVLGRKWHEDQPWKKGELDEKVFEEMEGLLFDRIHSEIVWSESKQDIESLTHALGYFVRKGDYQHREEALKNLFSLANLETQFQKDRHLGAGYHAFGELLSLCRYEQGRNDGRREILDKVEKNLRRLKTDATFSHSGDGKKKKYSEMQEAFAWTLNNEVWGNIDKPIEYSEYQERFKPGEEKGLPFFLTPNGIELAGVITEFTKGNRQARRVAEKTSENLYSNVLEGLDRQGISRWTREYSDPTFGLKFEQEVPAEMVSIVKSHNPKKFWQFLLKSGSLQKDKLSISWK